MNHSFSIGLACEYGIEEAILIHHFSYWIEKNRLNGNNFHDGKYWSYDSVSAMTQQFPYMNQKKLYRVINRLCDIGILEKGNYNKKQYDRTSWYTLTELGFSICQKWQIHLPKMGNAFDKNGKCISQKEEMDLPKTGNGFTQNGKPIPDTTTYTTTDTDIREDNATKVASHSPQQQFEIIPIIKEKEDSNMLGSTAVVISEKVARARKKSLEEREHDFGNSLIPYLDEYGKDTIRDFFNYWSEPNQAKTKMKYELQKTWSLKGRLSTWVKNEQKFNNNGFKTKRQQHEEGLLRLAEDVRISAERARNLTREEELKRLEDVPF